MKNYWPEMLLVVALFCTPLSAGPAAKKVEQAAPELAVLKTGIYHVQGQTVRGEYEGSMTLRKQGEDIYQLQSDAQAVGLGMRHSNTLSVGWQRGGVAVYKIEVDNKLTGTWTAGDGVAYPETLTFLKEITK